MQLMPNQTYCFRRGLDAYFCLAGRVQVADGACCEYRGDNRFYFPAVRRYLPDEAARLVTACPERYLMADNPQKKNKRRLYD